MKRNIKIVLLLCLSLVMLVGSASADEDTDASDECNEYLNNYSFMHNLSYNGDSIGPHNAMYRLKIAFGNIDEAFTFDSSERLCKQNIAANSRLAEVSTAMEKGDEKGAALALKYYNNKMKNIDATVDGLDEDEPGLKNAQRMIEKHQLVLKNLIQTHQQTKNGGEETGLMNAFNNSLKLEMKFNQSLEHKFNPVDESQEPAGKSLDTGNDESKSNKPGNSKK